ncbi:MAG: hypothetical protein ACLT38_06955 [Akkermansia sp.]
MRRMIRERVGGLDAAVREAMSCSICRRVSSLVREKNFRRVAVFAARPERWICFPAGFASGPGMVLPLVHEGEG